jgi:hypothetical protein
MRVILDDVEVVGAVEVAARVFGSAYCKCVVAQQRYLCLGISQGPQCCPMGEELDQSTTGETAKTFIDIDISSIFAIRILAVRCVQANR